MLHDKEHLYVVESLRVKASWDDKEPSVERRYIKSRCTFEMLKKIADDMVKNGAIDPETFDRMMYFEYSNIADLGEVDSIKWSKHKRKPSAFSEALALESIPESLYSVNQDDLVDYARTVAYKVFHNLKNNHEMDKSEDPLKVGNKPANEVWQHHYEKA